MICSIQAANSRYRFRNPTRRLTLQRMFWPYGGTQKNRWMIKLNKLSAELRNSSQPYLQEIGGVGLHELAEDQGGIYVSMQASLFEFNGSDGVGRQRAATKVLDAVNNYRSFFNTNAVLKVLDQHKNTTLVSSLHDALNKLENEMQRHAA